MEHMAITESAARAGVTTTDDSAVQLASAGGVSLQASAKDVTGALVYLSIRSDSFAGTAMVQNEGVESGLVSWVVCVNANIDSGLYKSREALQMLDPEADGIPKLCGHFIVIELFAHVAKWAGVQPATWVTHAQLLESCQSFIAQLTNELNALPIPHPERGQCFKVAYTKQIEVVLEKLYSNDSKFYYTDSWEPLAPDWTLGVFLS